MKNNYRKLFKENHRFFKLPEGFNFEFIDEKHTDFIISCRNDSKIIDLSLSKTELTIEKQQLFLEQYQNMDRIDLILTDILSLNPVGIFTIKNISKQPELGKIIGNNDYKGKGLAKAASKSIIDFGFRILNLKKIYAVTRSDNTINIALNGKLGFQIQEVITKKKQEWLIMSLTANTFYEQ